MCGVHLPDIPQNEPANTSVILDQAPGAQNPCEYGWLHVITQETY